MHLKHAYMKLGVEFGSDIDLNRAFTVFKDLADKKHEIFDEDLIALVADDEHQPDENIKLVSLNVASSTEQSPQAEITC